MRTLILTTIGLVIAFTVLQLCSCSSYPTPLPNDKGGSARLVQVAGKGQVTYNADGSMAFIFDNEISFQHLMQTAAAVGLSYIDMLKAAEEQLTQRFVQGQITRRQFNAGMLKLEEARIAAGLKSEGIQSGLAPLGKIEFQ